MARFRGQKKSAVMALLLDRANAVCIENMQEIEVRSWLASTLVEVEFCEIGGGRTKPVVLEGLGYQRVLEEDAWMIRIQSEDLDTIFVNAVPAALIGILSQMEIVPPEEPTDEKKMPTM